MNHRYRHAPPHRRDSFQFHAVMMSLALLIVCGTAVPALAQRGGLGADIRTAGNAAPHTPAIQTFVANQVKALQNEKDTRAQERARDALVRESSPFGAVPSPSFLEVYAAALNNALLPLAKDKNPRTRLIAAITLQKVAKNATNDRLAEAAAAFAQDACVGVALWAMKASQSILPSVAAAGKPHKLTGAIVEGARKHSSSGYLVEEAYIAITLGPNLNTRILTERSVPVVLGDVLRLFEFRVGQYVKQTPPRPDLERRGLNFLTLERVLETKEGVKRRRDIMQQISNLIGVAAQHAVARTESDRKVFVEQLRDLGDALVAVGGRADAKSPALQKAGKALMELQVSSAETDFTERANAAYEAFKERFPDLKAPPKIEEGAAAEPREAEIADAESEEAGASGEKSAPGDRGRNDKPGPSSAGKQ